MNIPNKITGDTYTAVEFTEFKNEVQNAILASGQSLASTSVQLKQALTRISSNGSSFTDSGSANTYVLGHIGSTDPLTVLADGAQVRFKAGNTNTGASTANVAGLGAKTIKKNGNANAMEAGDIVAGNYYSLTFNTSDNSFDIADLSSTISAQGKALPLLANNRTLISVAQLDIGWSDQADASTVLVIVKNLKVSANAEILIQLSFDNGSTFDSGASSYSWHVYRAQSNATVNLTDNSDSEIRLNRLDIDGLNDNPTSIEMKILNPREINEQPSINQTIWGPTGGTATVTVMKGGSYYLNSSGSVIDQVTGIRFFTDTGTIDSIDVDVYLLGAS